jgi:tRNA A-37 threonylcarbamoyl transferase component Bud32
MTLKNQLQILHQFNIVHFDVTTNNIAFSREFNCHIFIDYGLSLLIKESPGYLTKMNSYRGTYLYCSP